ncbi:hypothetical protein Hanom_Chr09g00777411 [Helianthus anomalus]
MSCTLINNHHRLLNSRNKNRLRFILRVYPLRRRILIKWLRTRRMVRLIIRVTRIIIISSRSSSSRSMWVMGLIRVWFIRSGSRSRVNPEIMGFLRFILRLR